MTTMKTPNTSLPNFAVCVILPKADGTLLAVSRRNDDTRWGVPGGKVDPGETHVAAAVRECGEEVGLTLEPSLLLPVYTGFCPGPGPRDSFWVTTYLYLGDVEQLGIGTPEPGLTIRWAPSQDLSDPKHSPFADYNRRALEAVALLQS